MLNAKSTRELNRPTKLEPFKYPLDLLKARRNRCENLKRERNSVTICVAAICKAFAPQERYSLVIGAADRMLTAGDIEFEPEQPKIVSLTRSIFCMLAGDSGLQTEIMQGIVPVVANRVAAQPANWWNVGEVSNLYSQFYRKAVMRRAANEVLAPLGLTNQTFLEKQRVLSPEFTHELTCQLQNFELHSQAAAIICGVDNGGSHIYVAHNGRVECQDAVGFAAIGAGDWHSNSHFMFAKHTRNRTFPETLLLVYSAKKRAEVAPGVGAATDMFFVGPALGHNIYPIGDHVIQTLQAIYEGTNEKVRQSEQEAKKGISKAVEEWGKNAAQPQAPAPGNVAVSTPPATEPESPAP